MGARVRIERGGESADEKRTLSQSATMLVEGATRAELGPAVAEVAAAMVCEALPRGRGAAAGKSSRVRVWRRSGDARGGRWACDGAGAAEVERREGAGVGDAGPQASEGARLALDVRAGRGKALFPRAPGCAPTARAPANFKGSPATRPAALCSTTTAAQAASRVLLLHPCLTVTPRTPSVRRGSASLSPLLWPRLGASPLSPVQPSFCRCPPVAAQPSLP
jgi:hypothetical protein